MTSKFCVRATLTGAALILAGLLAACSEPKPVPPPPPPPAVSLSPRLSELASVYRAYMARATAISPAFTDGAAIANSLKVGAAYEPKQLLRGAVAYGAVAALQDPAFVAGVRTYASHPVQRQEMVAQIEFLREEIESLLREWTESVLENLDQPTEEKKKH